MLASSRRCRLPIFFITVTLILTFLAGTAAVRAGGKKGQYQNYLNKLQNRFQTWDLNGDNVLDKTELAKAFRGPQAKPYDYVAFDTASEDPLVNKGKVKPYALALVCLPLPSLPVHLALAELLTKPYKSKQDSTINPAVLQYGDFQFLALVGSNDKIAKKDYDNWSKNYAKNMSQYDDVVIQVKHSQTKLDKAKKAKQKQEASAELAKHQAELANISAQLNAISPTIHQTLNVKK